MCGPWASSGSIACKLEMQLLESLPRPTESGTPGVAQASVRLPGDANAGRTLKSLNHHFLQYTVARGNWPCEMSLRDTAHTNDTVDPHSLHKNPVSNFQTRDKMLFGEGQVQRVLLQMVCMN